MKMLLAVIACLLCVSVAAAPRTVRVAVLNDGPAARSYLPLELIETEARAVLGREFELELPAAAVVDGGWDIVSIRSALARLLADDTIDVIITTGLIGTQVAADTPVLSRPLIGVAVADAVLQRFPRAGNASGKPNFVYLADDHTVGADLDQFHQLIGYRHLAVLADQLVLDALPELPALTARAEERLGVSITVLPAADRAAPVVAQLPAATDAVYVPPLSRFSLAELEALAAAFAARGLPTFSLVGQPYIDAGFLMTGAGRDVDRRRAARRVALNLQSILLGEDAGALKVGLTQPRKLAINMAAARAIGYSPRWRDLEGAIVVNEAAGDDVAVTTLVAALRQALAGNPALKVSELAPLLAAADVRAARAGLLPQLGLGAGGSVIDGDRGNPLAGPERAADVSLRASQLLYSENTWAGYHIAGYVREAETHGLQVQVLDTLERTATAYLDVLRAQAQAAVQRSNLSVTESNLELALARERVGQSGRGDVLRFTSELAIDRQNHYAALATADAARVELARLLNVARPEDLRLGDDGIPQLLDLMSNPRYQRLFDNQRRWEALRRYHVTRALERAPELARNAALIAGAERQRLAADRVYYVPDVSLVGQGSSRFARGGNGASLRGTGLDDESWSVGIEAELPLYLGGRRAAAREQASYELTRNTLERTALENDIRARTLAAMEQAGGSYPSIRLSAEAAAAARDNLAIVTDAYSAGAASITELNDAQDAALTAELSEAQARYRFMLDFIGVMRATGSFDVLLLADGLEQWYADASSFIDQEGSTQP